MKKQITSTDPFVFSLRAKLLRFAARLATHGALWLIPVLLFAGVLPHPGSRSETLAAAFLSACILILIRALGAQLLSGGKAGPGRRRSCCVYPSQHQRR